MGDGMQAKGASKDAPSGATAAAQGLGQGRGWPRLKRKEPVADGKLLKNFSEKIM